MIRFLGLIFFGLFWNITFASCNQNAIKSEEAKAWATSKGQELLLTLSETNLNVKYAKIDKMLEEDVNIDYISKFVIGKYGKLMNNQQQTRYQNLFRRYILSLYKKFNLTFDTSQIDFTITDVQEYPLFTTISCTINANIIEIKKEGETPHIPVKFKLIRNKNNRIQAVDVEIANISLVLEYRHRFYEMIKKEDEEINWFLDKFEDKVIANEKSVTNKASL